MSYCRDNRSKRDICYREIKGQLKNLTMKWLIKVASNGRYCMQMQLTKMVHDPEKKFYYATRVQNTVQIQKHSQKIKSKKNSLINFFWPKTTLGS